MLQRAHRFHGYNSVLPVYRQAQTVRTDGCSLHFKLNPRRKDYRVSVVVSKKVAKSAVQRNRIRRRVFEVVRTEVAVTEPYDLIISIFDAEFASYPATQVTQTIQTLFQKSGIASR